MTNGVFMSENLQEMNLLVSSLRFASGNSLWETHSGLQVLVRDDSVHKGVRRSISFWHKLSVGMSFKTRFDEDNGFE